MSKTLVAVLLLFAAHLSSAAEMTYASEITMTSDVLNAERQLFIRTPEGYSPNKATYPVLYVLHGQWDTLATVATLDVLGNEIPGFIVVGIQSKGPELHPTTEPSPFAQFIQQEVRPLVANNYSIANFQILSGHSNAGRFVLNWWLEDGSAFSRFFAFSPSIENGEFAKAVNQLPSDLLAKKAPLVLTIANEGKHI